MYDMRTIGNMLILYRRHLQATAKKSACRHADDRFYRKCRCPMWAEGTTPNGYLRRSLKTASWEDAEKIRGMLEKGEEAKSAPKAVFDAVEAYLLEKSIENRAEGNGRVATQRLGQFRDWCAVEGYKYLNEVNVEVLRRFRGSWQVSPATAANK